MDEPIATAPRKTARARKTATQTTNVSDTVPNSSGIISPQSVVTSISTFEDLISKISQNKGEFNALQRQIEETRQEWVKEQKQHEIEITQRNTQEDLERKREQETYQYNTNLVRKRAEDEFQDRKLAWEKDLAQRKQELEDQRKELEELRKQVSGFEDEKDKTTKNAVSEVEQDLRSQYEQEKKLREQEVKAEKDLLNMRIANLETENSRLNKDIEVLKRSLDEATRQVKEIAVKVIESGSNQTKPQVATE